MEIFIGQFLNGTIMGSLYAIIAIGLTLTFGITGIVNFSFGEFMMAGAYFTWYFADSLGMSYPLAVICAAGATGVLGLIADQLLFRFTRHNLINGLLVSVGLTIIMQAGVLAIWTATPKQLDYVIPGMVSLFGISLSTMRVIVFICLMLVIIATYMAIARTWTGRAAYAFAQNAEAARLMGVRTSIIESGVVVYSVILAGLGGALYASLYTLEPTLGASFILKGVEAAIVGGIGSLPGALFGGMLLGITEALGSTYMNAAWRDAYGLVFVVLVLLFRPAGLWSRTA